LFTKKTKSSHKEERHENEVTPQHNKKTKKTQRKHKENTTKMLYNKQTKVREQ